MRIVDIDEAKAQLFELLDGVAQGDEILIMAAGRPVARLVKVEDPVAVRMPGSMKGMFQIPADFDAPLPDYLLRAFDGTDDDS